MPDSTQPDRSGYMHHAGVPADSEIQPKAAQADAGIGEATVRLVAFSDAVVAIAITLLAIDLPIPVNRDHATFMASVGENTPEYLSFLISFTVIGIHWIHHHRLFQYVVRFSGRLVILNFGWLLLIVVTPFMTKLLGSDDLSLVTFGMYSISQALQMTLFALMTWTMASHGLLRDGTPAAVVPLSARGALVSAAAFAVSVPVYAIVDQWAFVCWVVIPVLATRLFTKDIRGGQPPTRARWWPRPARSGGGSG